MHASKVKKEKVFLLQRIWKSILIYFFFGMSIKNSEITTEISKYLVESISDDPPNNQHTREPLRDFREFPDIAFKYVDDDGNVPHVGQWDSYTNRLIIEKKLVLEAGNDGNISYVGYFKRPIFRNQIL